MKAVPIKRTGFRKGSVTYWVGIDGVFPPNVDAVQAASVMMKKLIQIKAYCARYSKPVAVLINSTRVPRYIHTAINALQIPMSSVVDKDVDAKYGDYYQVELPLEFIAKNSEVVLMFTDPNSDDDVDFGEVQTPVVSLNLVVTEPRVSLTLDPNEVVKTFKQPKVENNNPYALFYHEPLFRRVPYTYWKDLMDTMPDTSQMGTGTPTNVW